MNSSINSYVSSGHTHSNEPSKFWQMAGGMQPAVLLKHSSMSEMQKVIINGLF